MIRISSSMRSQRGAALVVSLVMLLVLTVLGVVGMSTATLELAMAGNMQYQNSAFEAADSIVESEMERDDVSPLAAPAMLPAVPAHIDHPYTDADGDVLATATARTNYLGRTALSGWQFGGAVSFSAFQFEISGVSRAAQGATASHRQGFYVVGPSL